MAEFVYHCEWCRKKHRHNRGYIFVYQIDSMGANHSRKQLYFCDSDCCDEWKSSWVRLEIEDRSPGLIPLPTEKINRREAVLATRKKNAGSHLEFFEKHVDCDPELAEHEGGTG